MGPRPPLLALALLLTGLVTGLAACTPYYGRLADHEQRTLDRATRARAEGDVAGACTELAAAAAGDAHPSLLIAQARCLMDPKAGTPDLGQAYALPSPRPGAGRPVAGPTRAAERRAAASADRLAGAGAMFRLGRAHLHSQGIVRDATLGMGWLRRAAEASSRGASLELERQAARSDVTRAGRG